MESALIKELVSKAQNKDKEAFNKLFDFYYGKVLNYTFRRTLDVEYSKDITSNTFLKVLKNIDGFEWKSGPFSFTAWVFKIATNEINQYFKKQSRYGLTIDGKGIFNPGDDGKAAEDIERRIDKDKHLLIINKAIRQLRPIYQDIIHLRYFEELSYDEISKIINKNENTIRVYCKRAKEELKSILRNDASKFLEIYE